MIKDLIMEKVSLPVDWETRTLGDICDIKTGKRDANHGNPNGKYHFFTCAKKHSYIDDYNFDTEAILVAGNGDVGAVKYFKGKFDAYQRTYILHNFKINVDVQLLFLLLNGYLKDVVSKQKLGNTMPYIKLGMLLKFPIILPPQAQQKQIVATLDKVFAAIDIAKANAEQNLKNAKELFVSYLQNVFENKGDNWEDKSIGEIGKPSMCKRILKEQTSSLGDIPFYKIGTFGKSPNAFITEELFQEYKTKYSFPKKGDILISASGTIGRRVAYDGLPAYFQDSNIVWIDNDESQVLNDYLYMFYGYCDWQPSTGATISRLYNANLKRIRIAFPNALDEQEKIVQKLNTLSIETKKLEAIYTQKIAELEEMKKSVLQKAFSGQLNTVT